MVKMMNSVGRMVSLETLEVGAVLGGDRFGMQAEFLVGLRVVSKWMVVKIKGWELGRAAG